MIKRLYIHEQQLYLSKDRSCLIDAAGNAIAERRQKADKSYYLVIGIESDAYEKVCINVVPYRVCILTDSTGACLLWDDVAICCQIKLVPKVTVATK